MRDTHDLVGSLQHTLQALGVADNDENFKDTPRRFAQFLLEHFPSSERIAEEMLVLKNASFPSDYKGMIAQKNTTVHGMCPHHLLPVEYKISIAYIPEGRVLGLSKLARLATLYGKMATLQEDVTWRIAAGLGEIIDHLGCMVVVEGTHSCMAIRGVRMDESSTVTSAVTGVFLDESKGARNEFLALIGRRS